MTVLPTVAASVSITASDTSVCAGTQVCFTAIPVNGGSNPIYKWYINGVIVHVGPTYCTTTLFNGSTVRVEMTSNAVCVTGSPAVSNLITITVKPTLPASVTVTASATAICAGAEACFTALPVNGGATPSFQWYVNGLLMGANSSTFCYSTAKDADEVWVIMTSNAPCVTGSPATSDTITISVQPAIIASVTISSADTLICEGMLASFTASPINGGNSPTYQWQVNGVNAGIDSTGFSSDTLNDLDVVTCIMTSHADCVVGSPATSNEITIRVSVCTGDKEVLKEQELSIYPNPSSGIFSVTTSMPVILIQVMNLQGQVVNEFIPAQSNGKCMLQLSNQPKGIYLLKVIQIMAQLTVSW